MELDRYQANLIAEMKIALDKMGIYTPSNALWHCGRLAYLAYAFARYASFKSGIDMDFETGYVNPDIPGGVRYE